MPPWAWYLGKERDYEIMPAVEIGRPMLRSKIIGILRQASVAVEGLIVQRFREGVVRHEIDALRKASSGAHLQAMICGIPIRRGLIYALKIPVQPAGINIARSRKRESVGSDSRNVDRRVHLSIQPKARSF